MSENQIENHEEPSNEDLSMEPTNFEGTNEEVPLEKKEDDPESPTKNNKEEEKE
jgi:hypothetical protein